MLGKLFNLSAGASSPAGQAQASSSSSASSKQVSSLESVQEDIHTRALLFPDPQALYQQNFNDQVFSMSSASALATSSTNPFDLDGDIELENRDVRVIIMQDTSSSSPASLLYDSQPLSVLAAASSSPIDRPSTVPGLSQVGIQDARRVPPPPPQRKASASQSSSRPVVIQPGSPQLRQSAFDRRSSVHTRTQSKMETDAQRAAREYKQEIDTFANCIFGNNEFLAYKGTSTKVHVVPSDLRNDGPVFGDGRGSMGRSTMRSSKLSQSLSSEAMPSFGQPASSPRPSDRKRVLITRLFPVNLPVDDALTTSPRNQFSEESSEFPFPHAHDEAKAKTKKAQLKQKRTPMYAVALIISLPQGPPQTAPASASRSLFRGSSSYNEQQDSFPSSYNSQRRSGWAAAGSGFAGFDSFDSGFNMDSEERIDAITRHWDVIMRTLTSLQSVVATKLFSLLKQADIASPDPLPNPAAARVSRASSNASQKPPKTNMKFVSLLPNCLAEDDLVKSEVDCARQRIVTGLRATRVVTGQNRWGIWRDEARWVEKWAGGRDHGFFFFNLLTGFLAVHTDWLQALSPSKYRRQFSILQKLKGDDDLSLPARTVIVAQDRTAARRLVFLLSAFLPANQQLPAVRTQRPGTSASFGNYSQSPPSFIVPLTKEESLRRKINRRGNSRHNSHSRNASMYATVSRSSVPAHMAHLSMEGQHGRRPSDAASIKTTNLPSLLGNDADTRKASAATIIAETSVPHFAVQKAADSPLYGRPESSSSLATDDLKRSLKRGDSMGSSDTQPSSRWGSVISGLWSTTKRRDSEAKAPPSRESLASRDGGASSLSPRKSTTARRTSLGNMMEEAQSLNSKPQSRKGEPSFKNDANKQNPPDASSPHTPRLSHENSREPPEPSRAPIPMERKPDPNSAFESPVKTTINEDGIIDVDVPFPDFITSFETAVSSPSSSGYLSTPGGGLTGGVGGLDLFEQAGHNDVPMNVAGWLQRYHPDFILQAIPPPQQPDELLAQIKASLRAEPTPPFTPAGEEHWVEVSSALVADSTDFTIRRVRYRRLVGSGAAAQPSPSPAVSLTPMISPYETCLREEFVEDVVVSLDEILIEAVERVLGETATSRKKTSGSSSRSHEDTEEGVEEIEEAEVPRGECKAVVLSALEHIARDVVREEEEEGAGANKDKGSILRDAVRTWVHAVEGGVDGAQ